MSKFYKYSLDFIGVERIIVSTFDHKGGNTDALIFDGHGAINTATILRKYIPRQQQTTTQSEYQQKKII